MRLACWACFCWGLVRRGFEDGGGKGGYEFVG